MRRSLAVAMAAGLFLAACGTEVESSSLSADAGADFTVAVGEVPVFNACDSGGDIANYEWTIVSAPVEGDDGKVLRATMNNCEFELENAMVIGDLGEWTIELSITDEDGDITASDEVLVTVVE